MHRSRGKRSEKKKKKGKGSEDGGREGVYLYKHYTDAFTNQAPPNTVMILEAPIVTTHRATLH